MNSNVDSDGNELTKGQAEYFAGSKMRDNNGHLVVMYRGGSGNHDVFDRKKSRPSNLYGRGFYFTNSKKLAEQYGKATSYYLLVKHLLSSESHEITRDQMRWFLSIMGGQAEEVMRKISFGQKRWA